MLLWSCSFDAGTPGAGGAVDAARTDSRIDARPGSADADRRDDARADARRPDAAVDAKPPAACSDAFAAIPGVAPTTALYWFTGDVAQGGYFEEARATCEEMGSYLYVPSDAAEQAAVGAWMGNAGLPRRAWVGIYWTNQGWISVLGTPPPFVEWASSEPDDNEDFAVMDRSDPWELYGNQNALRRPFVCECHPEAP